MSPTGKIPGSYRERSRWISVKNVSEFEIPPFAPCHFTLNFKEQDTSQPLVSAYQGLFTEGRRGVSIVNPAIHNICVNGPQAIPPGGYGEVSIDWPCVARVKYLKNRLQDPERRGDAFAPVYVDLNSFARGEPVAYFSDIGAEANNYQLKPDFAFYRDTLEAFRAIGIADEDQELYWIVPKGRPLEADDAQSQFLAVTDSQDIFTELVFDDQGETADFAKLGAGGTIDIDLPGVYVFLVRLDVAAGELLTAQTATVPTDYRLIFNAESLSDNLDSAAFNNPGNTLDIRQPSYLYAINCSGYYTCPKMDLSRPAVYRYASTTLTVTVKDTWKAPTIDGKVKAEPLVRISADRLVNFDHTADIPTFSALVTIGRRGFEDYYRNGYFFGVFGVTGSLG